MLKIILAIVVISIVIGLIKVVLGIVGATIYGIFYGIKLIFKWIYQKRIYILTIIAILFEIYYMYRLKLVASHKIGVSLLVVAGIGISFYIAIKVKQYFAFEHHRIKCNEELDVFSHDICECSKEIGRFTVNELFNKLQERIDEGIICFVAEVLILGRYKDNRIIIQKRKEVQDEISSMTLEDIYWIMFRKMEAQGLIKVLCKNTEDGVLYELLEMIENPTNVLPTQIIELD